MLCFSNFKFFIILAFDVDVRLGNLPIGFLKIENLYKVNSIEHPHCFFVVFQHVYKVTPYIVVTL